MNISTTGGTSTQQGPLTWQQEAGLQREHRYGRYLPLVNVFKIPSHITDQDFRLRLDRIIAREDALHIVDARLPGEGGQVSYLPVIKRPLRYERCGSLADISDAVASAKGSLFPRADRPLWEVTVLRCREPDGQLTRYACCSFDHLISDGYSQQLFEAELTGAAARVGQGSYRGWVAWQSSTFPRTGSGAPGPAREFWLRHLDGIMPDRPTPLPFAADPQGPGSGLVTTLVLDLPISVESLRDAAQVLRATPFLLVCASVISWIARSTGVCDLSMRVACHGRTAVCLSSLGWFADALPVRVTGSGLDQPGRALTATRHILADVLNGPHAAPWEYIRRICTPNGAELAATDGTRQLMLNFSPYHTKRLFTQDASERTVPGDTDALHLSVLPNADGCYQLQAVVGHDEFSPSGMRLFLRDLAEQLTVISEKQAIDPM